MSSAPKGSPWPKALALFAGGLVFARLFGLSVSPSFWWLGLLSWILLIHAWSLDFFRPMQLAGQLGRARVELNLHAAAHKPSSLRAFAWKTLHSSPFLYRLVYLALPILVFMVPPLVSELEAWSGRIATALTPRSLVLRAEPPAFAAPEDLVLKIRAGERLDAKIVAGSVVDLHLVGGAGLEALFADTSAGDLFARDPDGEQPAVLVARASSASAPAPSFESNLSSSGRWSGSTDKLIEELGLDKRELQTLQIEVREDGREPFGAQLEVHPAPLPKVTIERVAGPLGQEASAQSDVDQGELFFAVRAESETPLTQVELLVRSKSGYRFTMPIGEFAGSDRLEFSSDSVRLATIGIPFNENDVLYVKARAITFVKGLEGHSPELEFPVKGPSEVRRELIEQLESILSELQNHRSGEEPFAEWRQELGQQLGEASQSARELGRRSQPARAIDQARAMANRMPDDSAASRRPIESRLQDALESLKRRQAQEKTSSWFMKTRSHLKELAQSDLSNDEVRRERGESATDLADSSEELKNSLAEVTNSPSSGMTLEEKQSALDMLARDETPAGMKMHAESVSLGDKEGALQEGKATLEAATDNLGQIIQLIAIARARRIREAKERLQSADEALEQARQSQDQQRKRQETKQAQNELDGTPELGEVFDDALSEAREAAQGAGQALQAGDQGEFREQIDEAQEAIGEALSALQDEERSLREERSEEEGRRFRSAMDAMNAQGQLDSGWRKKIFEEISRLREEGVPADADIIRYLESRLR